MKKLKFIELLLAVATALLAAVKSAIRFVDYTRKRKREPRAAAAAA